LGDLLIITAPLELITPNSRLQWQTLSQKRCRCVEIPA